MFPGRSRTKQLGSCLYLGERAKLSQNIPSPLEGSSEHGHWYYWQYINHIHYPFILRLYNRLGCAISRHDWYIMRAHSDKAPQDESSQQKAQEFTQKINNAKINQEEEHLENPDELRAFPFTVNDSSIEDEG